MAPTHLVVTLILCSALVLACGEGGGTPSEIAWAPASEGLAFYENACDEPRLAVYSVDDDELKRFPPAVKGTERLFACSFWPGQPAWSPDGRRIAFVSAREQDNPEVFLAELDTGEVTRLTNSPGVDTAPAWSPDGRHIAFVTGRHGDLEVYVMGSDGTAPTNVSKHPADDGARNVTVPLGGTNRPTAPWWLDACSLVFSRVRGASSNALVRLDLALAGCPDPDPDEKVGYEPRRGPWFLIPDDAPEPQSEVAYSPDGSYGACVAKGYVYVISSDGDGRYVR